MPEETVVLSVRVPVRLAERLEKLAGAVDRTKSHLAVKAIEDYVADEEEFLLHLAEAEADAAKGRVVDHQDVSVWLRELAAGSRRPPPQSKTARRRR